MTDRKWEWQVDRMEQIAEALHNGWWSHTARLPGMRLGPRDDGGDAHPHLAPWSAKDDGGRNQDRFQAAVLLSRRVATFHDVTPEEIHEAWRLWVDLHRGEHCHARPYEEVHAGDPREHGDQAARVNRLLAKWRNAPTTEM